MSSPVSTLPSLRPVEAVVSELDPYGPVKLVALQCLWLVPVAALWAAIYLRGHWTLAGWPMLNGFHWMVPLAALLSAAWVARVLALLEERQPYLRSTHLRLDDDGLALAGARVPWSAIGGCAVLKNRHGWRIALETHRGPRAVYPGPGRDEHQLAELAEHIDARLSVHRGPAMTPVSPPPRE